MLGAMWSRKPSPADIAELERLRQINAELQQENAQLRQLIAIGKQEVALLGAIRDELKAPPRRLAYIKLAIGGIMPVGPVTLTVGDKRTATVLGFDQNGAPFTIDFNATPVAFADDNQAVVSDAPSGASDALTAVAPGVMNLTATCGGFSDSEAITVVAAPPVLSSIKISID